LPDDFGALPDVLDKSRARWMMLASVRLLRDWRRQPSVVRLAVVLTAVGSLGGP
jgi:hypothetical protein